MGSVTADDSGVVLDAEQSSTSEAGDDAIETSEDQKSSVLADVTEMRSIDSCAGVSRASESPHQAKSCDNQPLCVAKSSLPNSQQNIASSNGISEVSSSCTSDDFQNLSTKRVLQGSSFRRPDVSYASAVAGSITKRAHSVEVKSDSNAVDSKDSNSTSPNSSSNSRRKLSKQENVNESCSPIYIGPLDYDYLTPSTCSESAASLANKLSKVSRSTSLKFSRKSDAATSVSADRLHFVSGRVTPAGSAASKSVPLENHSSYGGVVPARARLVRSLAMCGDDDTRLRPPAPQMVDSFALGYAGFPVRSNRNSSSLSRESSHTENTSDLTEMELRSFITATLHKNPRDRALVLELEQIFTDFVNSSGEQSIKLPPVSSYNRMIIHRIAAQFGLDHNVDNSGRCVVVSKTSKTKQPDFLFASLIRSNIFADTRRLYPVAWNYREYGMGELARRAQSFEIGCTQPSVEPGSSFQHCLSSVGSQLPFEKHHFPYYMSFVNHGSMMKKADSFSGVPTTYQADGDFLETYDQTQNIPDPARGSIDETMQRFSTASLSDGASEMSISSNPTTYSGIYPQVMHYAVGQEIMYAQVPYQQQILLQPTSTGAPLSSVMAPMQPNPVQLAAPPTIPYHYEEHMANSGSSQDSHEVPFQAEFVNYHAHQYSSQLGDCSPQNYQSLTPTALPSQRCGQMVQQPLICAQQQYIQPHPAAVIQSPNQSHYHQHIFHQQLQSQHGYMSTQPMLQVHPHLLRQQQPSEPQDGTTVLKQWRQQMEISKTEQPVSHQHVTCGQWSTKDEWRGCHNGVKVGNSVTDLSGAQVIATPHVLPTQRQIGTTLVNPPYIFAHPEPMYHYSQISPVMSSMQQQPPQILQVQCNSRPLLYKPTQFFSQQTTSIDGGYCSMNQESDFGIADAQ